MLLCLSVCFRVQTRLSLCTLQDVSARGLPDCVCVLTSLSSCALQRVSAPRSLSLFPFPDMSLLCTLQIVSVPHSLGLFLSPELLLRLRSPGSECPPLARFVSVDLSLPRRCQGPGCECSRFLGFFPFPDWSLGCECPSLAECFRVLTCPFPYTLQFVSAIRLLGLFSCPDMPIPLCSPVCECPLLAQVAIVS